MSELVQEFLQTWESELLLLRPNDPLINLHPEQFIDAPQELWGAENKSKQLLRELKRIERERGVVPLVRFEGLLSWTKGSKMVQTPVFLSECTQLQPKTQKIELDPTSFLNPFLSLVLKKNGQQINLERAQEAIIAQLLNCGLFSSYTPTIGFANLHPQRYELRKEWEGLALAQQYSAPIHQLIGDADHLGIDSPQLGSIQISPLDPDQKEAIEAATKGSVVIYGPPGTGKSVVLSNLLCSGLYNGQSMLVLADKPIALEVLKGKLKQVGLDQFCVLINEQNGLKAFYKNLQHQFEQLLQSAQPAAVIAQTKPYKGQLYWQQKRELEHLTNRSLEDLISYFKPMPQQSGLASKRWLDLFHSEDVLSELSDAVSTLLPFLSEQWQTHSLQENLSNWSDWKALQTAIAPLQIEDLTALKSFVEKSLRCIQFEANVYQTHRDLLDGKTEELLQKLQRYQQLKQQHNRLQEALQVWKKIPTQVEWPTLKSAAEAPNWLGKRKWRQSEKSWLRTPGLDLSILEKDLKKHWQNQQQQGQIETLFAAKGVFHLEQELPVLLSLLKQHKPTIWTWYRSLSSTQIQQFCSLHQTAHRLEQLHQRLFSQRATDFTNIHKRLENAITALGAQQHLLQKLPYHLWALADQPTVLLKQMKQEFWADLRLNYAAIFDANSHSLVQQLNQDLQNEDARFLENAHQICGLQYARFAALQSLLEQPLQRLNPTEKAKRQELRKGKAILVKEMAKTRQHLSIQTLFEGPARDWLRVIFPIWMCSPTALAKTLPLQTGLFDLGIFDEASQLPLSHAIGALQRVGQIVVAGDPQQMRPQSYFGQSAEGVVDLLHQAAFYLPGRLLRHHYRSEDPVLISFSNRHFYNDKLLAWPAAEDPKNGIFSHYISNGVFEDQHNIKEAAAIAKHLRELLQQKASFGVVAFSEAQLNCIYKQLGPQEQTQLEQRIADRSAFFLPLEQVQGEECAILLISFGYAKNANGIFNLRLGPMVQAQGGRRLNVLLTRAKKALHFYSSVLAADFPSKRSAMAQLIWEWFVCLEQEQKTQAIHNAEERLTAAEDYPTYLNYYRVLKQRGALPDRV